MHVKKGDTVQIMVGKEKGKSGKILRALPSLDRVVVEGLNKVKKHRKGDAGIVEIEMPIHVSNVKKI